VARSEAYLHAKFYLDPSNRLGTIHQRYRQDRTDRQTTVRCIGRTVLQTVAQKSKLISIFGRPFVKRFALCYWTVVLSCLSVCLSVLSVTLVHCGQTIGWIKMKHGKHVGLSSGHTVLDEDPAPLPKKGQSPLPNFRPMSIVTKRLDGSR